MPSRLRAIDAQPVAVEHSHALAVASLPPLHRDPFDRLLVVQAQAFEAPILTADKALAQYPVETLPV